MSELVKREDAISRKELLDYINDHREDFSDYNGYSQMFDFVDAMPTVDAVPVGFIEALHTYYVRRSKALQGRIGHMYTLYALALEKLVQSFNYVNAMDDEMKTERNCADGERKTE